MGEEHVTRLFARASFGMGSLFRGERRDCRYVGMTHSISLVHRATELPLSFSAQ